MLVVDTNKLGRTAIVINSGMKLSVCIVNWNSGDFLRECLISIKESRFRFQYEILVVDNASTDNSALQIKTDFPEVKMLFHNKNSGFAIANNIAIHNSVGEYILLLNPDTLVYSGTVEAMLSFMDTHPSVAACGPQLVNPNTGRIEISAHAFPDLLPLTWNLMYLDRLFPSNSFWAAYQMTYIKDKTEHEVDWITGACILARREAISQVGGLDEKIFMYLEDVDWCYRFKQAEWQVFYLPQVRIAHYRGQSSKLKRENNETKLSVWGAQQYTRSILYFYSKHYGRFKAWLLRIIILMTAAFKAGLWITLGTLRHGWRVGLGRARSYLSTIPIAIKHIRVHD